MSIEESVILGQIPGTDYQPQYYFWFVLAALVVAVWFLFEAFRHHAVKARVQTLLLTTQRVDALSMLFSGTSVPTISSDSWHSNALLDGLVVQKRHDAFGIQLQLFKQKVLLTTRIFLGQLTQSVHKLRQSTLGTAIHKHAVAMRLPGRSLLVTQARGVITRLVV